MISEDNVETIMEYKEFVFNLMSDRTEQEQQSDTPVYTWDELRQVVEKAEQAMEAYGSQSYQDFKDEFATRFKMGLYADPESLEDRFFTTQKYNVPGDNYFSYLLNLPFSDYSIADLFGVILTASPFMWIIYHIFTQ